MNSAIKPAFSALIALSLAAAMPASAQTVQKSLPVVVNGKAHSVKAVTIGSQTYVPVSVLKELGIAYAVTGGTLSVGTTGGATQTRALEGCVKQELFNGNWRVTVQGAAFAPAKPGSNTGWRVDVKFANASASPNKLFVNSLAVAGWRSDHPGPQGRQPAHPHGLERLRHHAVCPGLGAHPDLCLQSPQLAGGQPAGQAAAAVPRQASGGAVHRVRSQHAL